MLWILEAAGVCPHGSPRLLDPGSKRPARVWPSVALLPHAPPLPGMCVGRLGGEQQCGIAPRHSEGGLYHTCCHKDSSPTLLLQQPNSKLDPGA